MKKLMLVAAFAAMFALVSCGGDKKDEKKTDSTEVKTETQDTTKTVTPETQSEPKVMTKTDDKENPDGNTGKPVRGN